MTRYEKEVKAFDRQIMNLVNVGVIPNSKSAAVRLRNLRLLIQKTFIPRKVILRIINP